MRKQEVVLTARRRDSHRNVSEGVELENSNNNNAKRGTQQKKPFKMIKVDETTHEDLERLIGHKKETFNDIIVKCIQAYKILHPNWNNNNNSDNSGTNNK
jgi:hypothetical protein